MKWMQIELLGSLGDYSKRLATVLIFSADSAGFVCDFADRIGTPSSVLHLYRFYICSLLSLIFANRADTGGDLEEKLPIGATICCTALSLFIFLSLFSVSLSTYLSSSAHLCCMLIHCV